MTVTTTHPADLASVPQATRLRGRLGMPPDKSISHRALLLAAVATGTSRIANASGALDPRSTAACLRALGVSIDGEERDGAVDWRVTSPGRSAWRAPDGPLDCGNSGTTMRLLAGLLAGTALDVTLDGDASLRGRPMRRVAEPLRAMGATVDGSDGGARPPLHLVGRTPLRPIDWSTAVPSAQVKSAILLAGLAAEGVTSVTEATATRDHTERMLRARGVEVRSEAVGAGGDGAQRVSIAGGQAVRPLDETVPGDISAAAFWLVAAAVHPDAELALEGVGVNPTRRAVIDLLRAMGASITERASAGPEAGEPTATLTARSSALEAIDVSAADVARCIDEIPVLALAAACARGRSRFSGAGELRHKESDRLVGIMEGLCALGADVTLDGDDLVVQGGSGQTAFGLRGANVQSLADHRLAMTFAIAGLVASGTTAIDAASSAAISYPGFFSDLERVRA
ncbi:MAG TPA: 3-phosphoshikimate 1-carboxyvinyltransferase [Candidatus Limnocylindrales bacterium]|jgi:3-phosphoshikimate 1-carboxyvinyltransferase